MEAQESILPLLIRQETQQVIVFRNHIQELVTKRKEQEVLTLLHDSCYNPNSKAFACFLDSFHKTKKNHLYTYIQLGKVSKIGAVCLDRVG